MIVSTATTGAGFFLDGLAAIQARQLRTQRQLSSGYKVQDASDAPLATAPLIRLAGALGRATVWRGNLDSVAAESNAADQALGSALDAVTSARTLAAQGATGTATAQQRSNLATQVLAIEQQLVASANTSFGGRYIFGGDQDQSAPYAVNPASATGVDKLTAQASTRVIDSPSGQTVYQPLTAAAIFDQRAADGSPGAANAFAAVQALANALTANDTAATTAASDSLNQAAEWLSQQQSYYGLASKRVTVEQQTTDNGILSLQEQISFLRDADLAQAATDLAQENTAQQAALAAQAQIPRKSLFDYLG
jgi:flagellar hook-associated protein 3 FlgL